MSDALKQPVRRIIENQVRDFAFVSERLAQLDGYKHVVLLSEGFRSSLAHGVVKRQPRGAPQASAALMEAFQSMYERFQASDAFLHTLDTGGLRHGFDPQVTDALHMLASGTGGEFLHNTNDLSGALNGLSKGLRHAYLLGFQPGKTRRGNNRIEVRVKGLPRGAKVSYRRGFSADPPQRTMDGLRLADIVLNDVPQTGLACRLAASADGLKVTIPAAAATELGGSGAVEIMLYIFDATGAAVDSRHLRVPVRGEDTSVDLKLELPSGKYVAKTLLRVGDSLGLSRIELER